jgi:DNA/RNA-binding domain of Phe-tRNA-synthetase-like protein
VEIVSELRDRVTLGVVTLRGCALPADYTLPAEPPADGDRQPARTLYRSLGMDPTRHRPSSEALQRRLQKGLGFPRVNALVDGINYCSVGLMLPFGGYDLDAIEGGVTMRLGRPGESYQGIGKPQVNLEGRLTLADAHGPFGNPSADSFRTRITGDTTNAFVTVFAPAGHELDRLDWVADTLRELVGGEAEHWIA